MKKLVFYCLWLSQFVQAQTAHHFSSSDYIEAGAYSKKFADVFSFTANPSGLSQTRILAAGIFSERKYLLKELNSYSVAVTIPTSFGGVGVIARYTGFSLYNETQCGLAYGKNLGPVDIGVRFNYSSVKIAGTGSNGVVHADAGMIWHILEKLQTGIHIINVVAGKLAGNQEEKPALIYKLGFGYEVSDLVFLSSEISKEENIPVSFKASLQYNWEGKFYFRAGITTATVSPWLGAGWSWKSFRIDITSSYHPQLGITPGLLVIFSDKKNLE